MDGQASDDAVAKTSVIKHMNGDHQSSLSYYLQYYARLPRQAASQPLLLHDITFTAMTIQSRDGAYHSIPLWPPLTSWADALPRAIAMEREARAALGVADVVVTEYRPPTAPAHLFVLGMVLFYAGSGAAQAMGWLVPGNWFYDVVMGVFPGGPTMYLWVQEKIAVPVVAIHVAEAVWMDWKKCRKYGVRRWSGLWFKWVGNTLVEGFGAHQRFNGLVTKAEAAEKRQNGKGE